MTTKDQVTAIHRAHRDWTPADIAVHLGCSAGFVRSVASRNGLQLPRSRGTVGRKPPPVPAEEGEPLYLRARVTLTGGLYQTFVKHTKRRGISNQRLVEKILLAVLSDDIVDAVIDDGAGR